MPASIRVSIALLFALGLLLASPVAQAQAKTYPDGHGGEVTFPQGDISFADEVVHYDTGSKAPIESARDPETALGIPDYDAQADRNFVSLGCGGELVLKFTDNQLIDIPGPDLYIFEVGADVEPTALAISKDGENWVRVGRIEGGKAEIDIAPWVRGDEAFRYVRLVDLKKACGSRWPGADIDAVGAIGSAQHIALSGEVLFETGKHALRAAATDAIDAAMAGVDRKHLDAVVVAGHTDAVGAAADNMALSERRAAAVADYLTAGLGFPADKVGTEAFGETLPVASNDTASGRARNRRVEITVRAGQEPGHRAAAPEMRILGLWEAGKYGIVEFREDADGVRASYDLDGGRLVGAFTSDTVFTGYWIEKSSKKACAAEKDGSLHWGRVRFEFDSADRDEFDARWAYCEEEDWSGSWPHGKRVL